MAISNLLFPIIVYVLAFFTAYLIQWKYKSVSTIGRYETIDGLRGFLALAVFIHHAAIWNAYRKTQIWEAPNSNFYNQCGKVGVTFFFMITSFLFVSKLLDSRDQGFRWRHFFISRICRLVPMYYFSLIIIGAIIMAQSQWKLLTSAAAFFQSILHWGFFTILDNPIINNYELTSTINAGVVWSLPYEWLFYFSLPLVALMILKARPAVFYIAVSLFFVMVFIFGGRLEINPLLSFPAGAIAPFLLRYTSLKKFAETTLASILIITCTYLIFKKQPLHPVIIKILVAAIFTFIATGNTMFGLLKNKTLKFLGDISYSTYLLHGILLFAVIYIGIGLQKISTYTPWEYCLLIFILTPILVWSSYLGYRFIEKPFIDWAKRIK
jgi:peptidoglycan/LPS O-acetylase OafA/YrhL